jgi:hypothetical protein
MEAFLLDHAYGPNNSIVGGPLGIVVPFVACGTLSGFDSDRSYPLQLDGAEEPYVFREPVQPPIRPNYHSYQERKLETSAAGKSSPQAHTSATSMPVEFIVIEDSSRLGGGKAATAANDDDNADVIETTS